MSVKQQMIEDYVAAHSLSLNIGGGNGRKSGKTRNNSKNIRKTRNNSKNQIQQKVEVTDEQLTPCQNYEELRDCCFEEWKRSEGYVADVYGDIKGYPTTGIGFLIYSPSGNGTLAEQKKRFKELDFQQNGRTLSTKEKEALFDRIVRDYNAGKYKPKEINGRKITQYPLRTEGYKLTEEGFRKGFDSRFSAWCEVAEKQGHNLYEMPRATAVSLMHAYWWSGYNAKRIPSGDIQRTGEALPSYFARGNYEMKIDSITGREAARKYAEMQLANNQDNNKQLPFMKMAEGGRE